MPVPLLLMMGAMAVPLGTFLLLILAGRRLGTTLSGIIGTASSVATFTLALIALMHWLYGGVILGEAWGAGRGPLEAKTTWIASMGQAGPASQAIQARAPAVVVGIYIDSLTMLVLVSGLMVSCAACVFTTGYLKLDVRGPRVFALLALGDATLVGLATSLSLPQWAAWSIIGGVSAYLLALPVPLGSSGQEGMGIFPVPRGLRPSDLSGRANAALALLCIRLAGDALILLGCGNLLGAIPGLSFPELFLAGREVVSGGTLWLLLAGALCHAAVFPMSGFVPEVRGLPTPAAALVLTCTVLPMGVLLIIRLFPLLGEPDLLVLGILGGLTSVLAAISAIAEADLRRLVAWLVVGSLGAMLSSIAAGSPGGAVLQMTATLFGGSILLLATGSVLHNCLGERRLSRYGGLVFRMPASSLLLAHGAGTLLGGPFLAGSGSWNTMLSHAYRSVQAGELRGWVASASLWATLPLLAFAAGRLWSLVFAGRSRDREVWASARESATLSVPVAFLAVVATVSGHPSLSPVRQLVLAWPNETVAAVDALRLRNASETTWLEDWHGMSLAREVAPPVVKPPPAPDDVQPAGEVDEAPLPPDDKTPKLIDPLRWSIAGALALTGLLLPVWLRHTRGSGNALHGALASAGYLPPFVLRLAHALSGRASQILLGIDALILTPVWELCARTAMRGEGIASRTRPSAFPLLPGGARSRADTGERRRLLVLVTVSAFLALALATTLLVRAGFDFASAFASLRLSTGTGGGRP